MPLLSIVAAVGKRFVSFLINLSTQKHHIAFYEKLFEFVYCLPQRVVRKLQLFLYKQYLFVKNLSSSEYGLSTLFFELSDLLQPLVLQSLFGFRQLLSLRSGSIPFFFWGTIAGVCFLYLIAMLLELIKSDLPLLVTQTGPWLFNDVIAKLFAPGLDRPKLGVFTFLCVGLHEGLAVLRATNCIESHATVNFLSPAEQWVRNVALVAAFRNLRWRQIFYF